MLYQLTHYERALEVCLQAIERATEGRRFLYIEMGSLHRYRGDFPGAEPWFRKAIGEAPDDSNAYTFLGAVQARQGKLAEAEETHRRGTQCTKGCIEEAHHNLGLVL